MNAFFGKYKITFIVKHIIRRKKVVGQCFTLPQCTTHICLQCIKTTRLHFCNPRPEYLLPPWMLSGRFHYDFHVLWYKQRWISNEDYLITWICREQITEIYYRLCSNLVSFLFNVNLWRYSSLIKTHNAIFYINVTDIFAYSSTFKRSYA